MINFLIITQPRSGSAWFMSCLHSHPQIYCPRLTTLFSKRNLLPRKLIKSRYLQVDNPISPYYQYRSRSFKRQIAHYLNRNKAICTFLSELFAENHDAGAVGYKVNYSQIKRHPVIIAWIKQNNLKIIHLIRNNLLKRLVSHKVANTRNLRHSTQPLDPIKIHIDPAILQDNFQRIQKRFNKYRKLFAEDHNGSFFEISYESMLDDHTTEMQKVLKFLGVDSSIPLNSDLVKVNPDSLEDIVENYSEVKQTLRNTEFENFLY
jgi:LPS sulfotransferase NodH